MATGRTQGPTAGRIVTSLLGRRAAVLVALIAIAAVAGAVAAATPATNGYRGIAYGGGASRPTSDKPQSKLWYTDGSWFAGMFRYKVSPGPISSHRIFRLNTTTHDWIDTGAVIDERDNSHGDYLWDEDTQSLYVASVGAVQVTTGAEIVVSRFTYNAATNAYTRATGVAVPGTAAGAHTVSIAQDTTGRLWTAWPSGTQVLFSTSTDNGVTWSTPAQVPAQAGNPIRGGTLNQSDTATVVAFGSSVAIGWSDEDLPTADSGGYYVAVIAAGADPSVPESWSLERLPSLVTTVGERSDNHFNMKAASDGTVYAVGKTRKDTVSCTTNRAEPLVEAFRRTPAGTWSVHLVATVGDCVSRPQIVLNEQLGAAWVLLTTPNGGGAIHMKSAPLSGPDALVFRDGADTTSQPGIPFIRSATETRIDDATTTKQSVTSPSGLVVLANNAPTSTGGGGKYYLHNELALPAADITAPTGTVMIAGGAAIGGSVVSVAVPATDTDGSGVSLVRLSNSSATSGGVLTAGQSFAYTTPVSWTLPAPDGSKTVYAQWRDAAGNWSGVQSDTIVRDATPPTGTVSINAGAPATSQAAVTLNLTANDGTGSGVAQVLISNTADFTGVTPITYAASLPWTLPAGDGLKTVHVKFVDALGNTSEPAVIDQITLDTVAPTAGTVVIDDGDSVANSLDVTLTTAGAGGGATQARASNSADMSNAVLTDAPSGDSDWTLASGADGPRTVYVQWGDAAGNWSPTASDSIVLDLTAPTGAVTINGGALGTRSTAASLTFGGTDGDVTEVRVGSAANLSDGTYVAYTPGMSLPFTLPGGTGTRTVYAQFTDVGGLESPIVSDTIILDTTLPTAPSAPAHKLTGKVTTAIPIRLSWTSGTDTGSGVKGYLVQRSVNGGAWTAFAAPTNPLLDTLVKGSTTYRFRVATVDHAGNVSAYRAGASFRTAHYSEANSAVRYTGTWRNTSSPNYFGGKAKYARTRSATASVKVTGRQFGWVGLTGPTSGSARVYVNGTLVATVKLYAPTTSVKKLVFTRSWSTSGTRTVKIVLLGTAGHPRVTVDGFFVLR